jgi:hypothetical protein
MGGALLFGAATFAYADPVTISFSNITTSPTHLTPSSPYSESGFTVSVPATNSGDWLIVNGTNEGHPPPGAVGGLTYDTNGNGGAASSSVVLTQNDGLLFSFDSFSLAAYASGVSYTVTGYDGSTALFTESGTDTTTGNSTAPVWSLIALSAGDQSDLLTSVTISLDDPTTNSRYGIDNLAVTSTPEPTSLIMLGTALIGVGVSARRRLFV